MTSQIHTTGAQPMLNLQPSMHHPMRALEVALKMTNVIFKRYSTNEVVSMYESCEKPSQKEEFNKLIEEIKSR
ncbi:hypothetical protein LCGC14_2804080 [marine sediment metagenome]|uniref:Uncharacterized protein n=1 Tax=marine sediment metagenome TaxID=412755 RepID=A0A0F9BD90_9ZZZZ